MLQVHHFSFEFVFQYIHKSKLVSQRLESQKQVLVPYATLGYPGSQYNPETLSMAKSPVSKNLETFIIELGELFYLNNNKKSWIMNY